MHVHGKENIGEQVESAIANDLQGRIVDQERFLGETATDGAIVAVGESVEKVTEFREDLHEIAIHCEHVTASGGSVTVAECEPHSVGRLAIEELDTRLALRNLACYLSSSVSAAFIVN